MGHGGQQHGVDRLRRDAGLRERVRSAVLEDRRLKADEVLVVRRGSLPKTSSGKVQRRATRQQYLEGGFGTVAAPSSPDAR
ncbi:hypothetical protein [Streptomyces sp. wa22]|uniref:hypothetical protein n=1 Tax=Streptomyces sp. wa22 TaxID=1828244 RepID=UPI0021C7D520|nr:hypothetical protein [Streptomyces sp. wa22]